MKCPKCKSKVTCVPVEDGYISTCENIECDYEELHVTKSGGTVTQAPEEKDPLGERWGG